ncbi:MAG: RIP metalloprotease RseP [Bacteroidota bacterium]|nr:RIP metalloprotease RseP [Bacteroidota bacterium]MDP4204367.1 RIP metalloprotease RseP [Bacteroidota bacterium]
MEILIKAAQLILSLSILVILHEFGHFFFARLFKCRVEKFYLFFDPWFSLYKTKKGETEYGIGWIPLGGYVKISGMIDESMDKEQLKLPPKPYEFRSKAPWQRLLIMIGGVTMNFIFAILIYIGVMFTWGKEYLPTTNAKYGIVVNETGKKIGLETGDKILSVDNQPVEEFFKIIPQVLLEKAKTIQVERNGLKKDVEIDNQDLALLIKDSKEVIAPRLHFGFYVKDFSKGSPAKAAGMKVGDQILALNDKRFVFYDEFTSELKNSKNNPVKVTVLRKNAEVSLIVTPTKEGLLGIFNDVNRIESFEMKTIHYSFFASIPAGIDLGVTTVRNYLKQFKLIFSPETKAYQSLGGFIAIGKIFPGTWSWFAFWNLTALLSIILAVMNLLPIPALDGGHVLFLLFEIITGRKPGEKFLEYAQIAGMVLLLALVLFANGNDIVKLFK